MSDQLPSEQLSIGDLCVIVGCGGETEGKRCSITGYLQCRVGCPAYAIQVEGESKTRESCIRYLRKIKPPREDLKVVRWDQCPWSPEKLHV